MLERLLQGTHTVRWLFIALGLGIAATVMLKFLALPVLSPVLQPLGPFKYLGANIASYAADAIVQTLLTTAFLAVFFIVLVPKELRSVQIRTIDPRDIRSALNEHIAHTDQYWFRGRSARWFRSTALPALVKLSQSDGRTRSIFVLLPDPCTNSVMHNYAYYRNSISYKGRHGDWSSWDIQKEILSAIVSLAHAHCSSVLVEVKIGLLDSYALLRSDITSRSAILTREDPKAPAIMCLAGTALYDTYREEILQGIAQGRPIVLDRKTLGGRCLDGEFVKSVLEIVGLNSILTDKDKIQEILSCIQNPHNPYA